MVLATHSFWGLIGTSCLSRSPPLFSLEILPMNLVYNLCCSVLLWVGSKMLKSSAATVSQTSPTSLFLTWHPCSCKHTQTSVCTHGWACVRARTCICTWHTLKGNLTLGRLCQKLDYWQKLPVLSDSLTILLSEVGPKPREINSFAISKKINQMVFLQHPATGPNDLYVHFSVVPHMELGSNCPLSSGSYLPPPSSSNIY